MEGVKVATQYPPYKEGPERGKMGTGIDLFLGWKMGFGFVGLGFEGMGNEVVSNGNGIEAMRVDFHFFQVLKCNFGLVLVIFVVLIYLLYYSQHYP